MDGITAPERVLVVIPHPDDAEGGCGGTIAKWISQGSKAFYLLCTDGRRGTDDLEMEPSKLAQIRENEQAKAAKILGIEEVVYLRYPDGELEDTREFRGQVVREIRRVKPDVILTTEPHRFPEHQHRDHRMSGQVSLDACFPYARDPFHFPEHLQEGFTPHKVGSILFWGASDPRIFVDITESIDLKVRALGQHVSQVGDGRAGRFVTQRARQMGNRAGMLYAEGFREIKFRR